MPGLPEHIAYTKVPNFIIEQRMANLKGSELKVALAICRKTYGFHKELDGIALTQIKELTGLGKNTVIRALRNLIKQKIINRYVDTSPYRYGIILTNHSAIKQQTKNGTEGSINEPRMVQKVNPSGDQILNPQKKPLKKTERNTTSSSDWSVEILFIAEYWNEVFNKPIDLSDVKMVDQIKNSLDHFSIEEIKKAIFNRSRASYYRENKPFLIDKPSAFFPYPETIANDLKRKTEGIYTYEEKNERIFQGLNTDDDFQIMRDLLDEQRRPKWQLKHMEF
ncbi:replication protein [Halalkalibaculum sp. DA3122]|uniref:replication protein n=1 Tax=Halalkalibaculum sp. DA3122 TaxID=3373607 RepID=UPI0037541792